MLFFFQRVQVSADGRETSEAKLAGISYLIWRCLTKVVPSRQWGIQSCHLSMQTLCDTWK